MQWAPECNPPLPVDYDEVHVLLRRPTTFVQLPEDILLSICEWLSVRDTFALRSTSKKLCEVTKNSAIWLSLLSRLALALSPRQYISHDAPRDYYLHTVEFFVSRALKLEQNWRDYNPLPKYYQFNGHQQVTSMRNLPGSKYMASISLDPLTERGCIVIWDINFRGGRNQIAIAMLNSETPVHKLHARYALVKGEECLLVAFTRPPVKGKTMITVACISVLVLEQLSRFGPGTQAFEEYSKLVPNPFSKILETQTRYPVGALSLSDITGMPILATVHRPRIVLFYFLDSGTRASLKLASVSGYENWRNSIWEIKILPSQYQLLVIRVLIGGDLGAPVNNPIALEIYDIPPAGTDVEGPIPRERKLVQDYSIDGFYVSDAEASWWPGYRRPHTLIAHEFAKCPPPPISIFVTTKKPRGFVHYLMRPEITHDRSNTRTATQCVYRLPTGTHAEFAWGEDEQAVILPGAYRSIVWMRSPRRQPLQGIEVLQLALYRTEGYTFSDISDTGHVTNAMARTPTRRIPSQEAQAMEVDVEPGPGYLEDHNIKDSRKQAMKYPVVPEDLAQAIRGGMQSIQFDEWLGRLCIATTEDNWLRVLDWSI